MEIAPMTKRDKILLYVVSMFAFIVLFVRFLLIPGIENHQQAAADLTEAQDAQIAMQDSITVPYTHLRAHETVPDLVCRLLLEKKKKTRISHKNKSST